MELPASGCSCSWFFQLHMPRIRCQCMHRARNLLPSLSIVLALPKGAFTARWCSVNPDFPEQLKPAGCFLIYRYCEHQPSRVRARCQRLTTAWVLQACAT